MRQRKRPTHPPNHISTRGTLRSDTWLMSSGENLIPRSYHAPESEPTLADKCELTTHIAICQPKTFGSSAFRLLPTTKGMEANDHFALRGNRFLGDDLTHPRSCSPEQDHAKRPRPLDKATPTDLTRICSSVDPSSIFFFFFFFPLSSATIDLVRGTGWRPLENKNRFAKPTN